jgi:DNA-binding CsgD family transcriptional regulator/tetratricopeptide (TPR) repeat protein
VAFYKGDVLDALEAVTTALEEADDDGTRARCLHTLGTATFPADPAPAVDVLAESAELAARAGDLWCEADALQMAAYALLDMGHHQEAVPLLERSVDLARAVGNRFQEAWHLLGMGFVAGYEGRPDAADEGYRSALALGRELGDPAVESQCALTWSWYLADRGSLDDLKTLAAELAAEDKEWGLLGDATVPTIVALAGAEDDPAGAIAVIGAVAEGIGEAGLVNSAAILWVLAARIAMDVGDLTDARAFTERVLATSTSERSVAQAQCLASDIDRHLAPTDTKGAEALAHASLDTATRLALVEALPLCLEVLGGCAVVAGAGAEAVRLLAAADASAARIDRRRSGPTQQRFEADVAAAHELVGDAFDELWAEGQALTLEDAVAYARRARGERKRPTLGWDALTPTEAQVAELVAEGLSNPDIATRLLMGRETVKTHLSRCFTKLQVTNRAELAVKVATRRPDTIS